MCGPFSLTQAQTWLWSLLSDHRFGLLTLAQLERNDSQLSQQPTSSDVSRRVACRYGSRWDCFRALPLPARTCNAAMSGHDAWLQGASVDVLMHASSKVAKSVTGQSQRFPSLLRCSMVALSVCKACRNSVKEDVDFTP